MESARKFPASCPDLTKSGYNLDMEEVRGISVHPDGTRIAFAARQARSEVWVIENLLPAL